MAKYSGRMLLAFLSALACAGLAEGAERGMPGQASKTSSVEAGMSTKNTISVRLSVNGRSVMASLDDNASTRDLLAALPMTLTLEDYAGTEKIHYLSKKLSVSGAPAGFSPVAGDIAYYAPWGNLAFFYKGAAYARGLVKLGHIDGGADILNVAGALSIKIDRSSP